MRTKKDLQSGKTFFLVPYLMNFLARKKAQDFRRVVIFVEVELLRQFFTKYEFCSCYQGTERRDTHFKSYEFDAIIFFFSSQVADQYAFIPREAISKFLLYCIDCQRKNSLESHGGAGGSGGVGRPPKLNAQQVRILKKLNTLTYELSIFLFSFSVQGSQKQ